MNFRTESPAGDSVAANAAWTRYLAGQFRGRTFAEWFRSIFFALIVVSCMAGYAWVNVVQPIAKLSGPSDSFAYFHAAQDILQGKSPYSDPVFFYPPLLAFLMIPLGMVDYETARWIWFLVSHLCLIGAAWILWRSMGGGRLALCCIALVWAFGGAINETLRQGQLTPVLVLILVIAYTRRGRLQGAFAGLGFALKYFPGIVVLPLVLGRRWRALAASVGVVILGLCLPWLALTAFFTGAAMPVRATYWMGTPSMFSWSVPSLVLRLMIPIRQGMPLPSVWEFGNVAADLHLSVRLEWISVATALVILLGGIAVLAAACRGRLNEDQIPWAMAALIALSLAVAPVCWTHYQLLQYPGAAMLLITALRRRYWGLAFVSAAAFALIYQLPERFLIHYRQLHHGWTTDSPFTLYFWTSVPVLATLAIFAAAIAMVRIGPQIHTDAHRCTQIKNI